MFFLQDIFSTNTTSLREKLCHSIKTQGLREIMSSQRLKRVFPARVNCSTKMLKVFLNYLLKIIETEIKANRLIEII